MTTSQPLRLLRQGDRRFAVDGTPADCVRVALHQLVRERVWILSGINAGGNLGADVYHSGTVAAVREGALHGCPGIALSQYLRRGLPVDWSRAAGWVVPILREVLTRDWRPGVHWSVNLPHLRDDDAEPGTVDCPLDPEPLPLSYRLDGEHLHYDGNYHQRRRGMGTDVDVCFGGAIAVTRLSLF